MVQSDDTLPIRSIDQERAKNLIHRFQHRNPQEIDYKSYKSSVSGLPASLQINGLIACFSMALANRINKQALADLSYILEIENSDDFDTSNDEGELLASLKKRIFQVFSDGIASDYIRFHSDVLAIMQVQKHIVSLYSNASEHLHSTKEETDLEEAADGS